MGGGRKTSQKNFSGCDFRGKKILRPEGPAKKFSGLPKEALSHSDTCFRTTKEEEEEVFLRIEKIIPQKKYLSIVNPTLLLPALFTPNIRERGQNKSGIYNMYNWYGLFWFGGKPLLLLPLFTKTLWSQHIDFIFAMLIQHVTLSINSKEWHIVTLTVTFIHYKAFWAFASDISFCVSHKNRQVKNVIDPGIELVIFHSPYGRSNQLG